MASPSIQSVAELVEYLSTRHFGHAHGAWVYRGHSSRSYRLEPSVARGEHRAETREKHERQLFRMFKREARLYAEYAPADAWEWLALGQHHGLPTRLIDFSHNPLVAAYFAVCSDDCKRRDGEIIALRGRATSSETARKELPFEIPRPIKFYPEHVSRRIAAQEGLFVAVADINSPLDDQLPSGWDIERIRISAKTKPLIRYQLFRLGVHDGSLFPGLEGMAKRVLWQHKISPGGAPAGVLGASR